MMIPALMNIRRVQIILVDAHASNTCFGGFPLNLAIFIELPVPKPTSG